MGLKEFFLVEEEAKHEDNAPFDWKWMCMPRMPWSAPSDPPPFYKLHQRIPWLVAVVMGFQHSLAMVGAIVTSPLLLNTETRLTSAEQEYLISACLITSGLLSMIQITQFKFGDSGLFLGTGLISLLGTAIDFIPIGRSAIRFMLEEDGDLECTSDADCTNTWADASGEAIPGVTNVGQCNLDSGMCRKSGQEAYGAFLGTLMVGALFQIGLSFVPKRYLKRVFPPMVTGICVLLVGISITGLGLRQWGGGEQCAKNTAKRLKSMVGKDMMGNFAGELYPSVSPCAGGHCDPLTGALSGICNYTPAQYDAALNKTFGDITICETFNADVSASAVKCNNNGEVLLPFGSPEYVGLGFAVFGSLVLIEVFGSPFLRNCSVILALFFGVIVAAVATYSPANSEEHLRYITSERITKAPAFTFLWTKTFPIGFYAPALVPVLLAYSTAAIDTIGDITCSAEASGVSIEGDQFDRRIQGGLLADGIGSILAALGTATPNTTFSLNNSVISLTRCANKRAGYWCAFFLVLYGMLAKVSALIVSIPHCVLGGMTTYVFVNVSVTVLRTLGHAVEDRRNRFIVAASLGLGIGVSIVPEWATNALIPSLEVDASQLAKLTRDSAVIVLSTPYAVGTIVAMILHAVVPADKAAGPVDQTRSETDSCAWTETAPSGLASTDDSMAKGSGVGGFPTPNMHYVEAGLALEVKPGAPSPVLDPLQLPAAR